jgi:hypothetical protein
MVLNAVEQLDGIYTSVEAPDIDKMAQEKKTNYLFIEIENKKNTALHV